MGILSSRSPVTTGGTAFGGRQVKGDVGVCGVSWGMKHGKEHACEALRRLAEMTRVIQKKVQAHFLNFSLIYHIYI